MFQPICEANIILGEAIKSHSVAWVRAVACHPILFFPLHFLSRVSQVYPQLSVLSIIVAMQSPTCTGIRIRSARDANVLFHAVALNMLPLIVRRLDETERLQVHSGCVYVWEERAHSYFDSNGQEMKRFTEG